MTSSRPGPQPTDTDRLREASEAATPGPWLSLRWQIGSEADEQAVADAIREYPPGRDEDDAAFIVAAVNYVRAVLAALAAAPSPTDRAAAAADIVTVEHQAPMNLPGNTHPGPQRRCRQPECQAALAAAPSPSAPTGDAVPVPASPTPTEEGQQR